MIKDKGLLTQEQLKQLLSYDSISGRFTWLVSLALWIKPGTIAGKVNDKGYRSIKIGGRNFLEHRLAWLYVYGEFPDDVVDHIDHDTTNNRIENLRVVSQNGNMHNYIRPNSNNKSGFLGVYKSHGRYQSGIKVYGITKHLGTFDTAEQAHAAYVAAKRELHPTGTL